MATDAETRAMIQNLFKSTGLELSENDLNIMEKLHASFSIQRSALATAVRMASEPMTIPAFDRARRNARTSDE